MDNVSKKVTTGVVEEIDEFAPSSISEENEGQYPDTIWAGKCYPMFDPLLGRERLIISLKIYQASKDINLARHLDNDLLCFKAIKKKEKDKYNNTYFVVVDQDPPVLWPKQNKVSNLNLADLLIDEYGNFKFTLSKADILSGSYSFGTEDKIGRYMKLEMVENITDARVFRYTKKFGKEAQAYVKGVTESVAPIKHTKTDKLVEVKGIDQVNDAEIDEFFEEI